MNSATATPTPSLLDWLNAGVLALEHAAKACRPHLAALQHAVTKARPTVDAVVEAAVAVAQAWPAIEARLDHFRDFAALGGVAKGLPEARVGLAAERVKALAQLNEGAVRAVTHGPRRPPPGGWPRVPDTEKKHLVVKALLLAGHKLGTKPLELAWYGGAEGQRVALKLLRSRSLDMLADLLEDLSPEAAVEVLDLAGWEAWEPGDVGGEEAVLATMQTEETFQVLAQALEPQPGPGRPPKGEQTLSLFRLVYLEGQTTAQAALSLGLRPAAARQRLSYWLRAIKASLPRA